MSLLYEHRVHPSEFLTYFSKMIMENVKHKAKLIRMKVAHRELEENLTISELIVDQDYSQNFDYTSRKTAIQSEHWKSASTTIFVAVARFLCHATWMRPIVGLKKGQAVSVKEEVSDGGEAVYVYGEIAADQTNGPTVLVKIKKDLIVECPCENVRERKIISVPIITVSDTKSHDTYFVRDFLEKKLLGPNGWLSTYKPELGLKDRITILHICSDGAASHFKQKGSLHFITYLSFISNLTVRTQHFRTLHLNVP